MDCICPVQDEYLSLELRYDYNSSVESTLLQRGMEAKLGLLSLRTWCHLEGGLDALCLYLFRTEMMNLLLQAHNVQANKEQEIHTCFFHPSCITE